MDSPKRGGGGWRRRTTENNITQAYIIITTVEPLIKHTIEIQFTNWRLSYSSNIFLTSDKGQPLNKGQNGQKTMGPKHVRYSA